MRLLLVEDNVDVAETLIAFLQKTGFVVDLASSLEIARDAIEGNEFDLILLDRMLPDGDGLSLLAHAEDIRKPQRVILLSALETPDDKVAGFASGANDYIAKPFEPRELIARIRNVLRLPRDLPRRETRFGPMVHDMDAGTFAIDGRPLILRRTEALVLAALMTRPGVLVQRGALEMRVYGYDKLVNANSLESQISRLRKYLIEQTGTIRIRAVRGVGYRLTQE